MSLTFILLTSSCIYHLCYFSASKKLENLAHFFEGKMNVYMWRKATPVLNVF